MTVKEIFAQLKALSNEKMVTLNTKNGAASGNQFGVKLGDIRNLAKKIKINPKLAVELWETKNIDARLLAILILKPKELSAKELDKMVKSLDFPQVSDWFNAYILKEHPEKELLREEWMSSDNIWAARSGWSLTAGKVAKNAAGLNIEKLLNDIEKNMPEAPPEVQWTMNTTLAYIGIYHPKYRQRAIKIAEELGIYKDYPVSKGCTSPFVPIWINEMVRRQENE